MATTSQPFQCATHNPLPVQDQGGHPFCYNCIIETYQTPAYSLACRVLNDWALAEDAVQESFLSGYRAFHQFRGDNLRAWIMRIVANTCRDMLRAQRARPATSLNPLPADPDDPAGPNSVVDLLSDQESPEEYAERRELNRTIEAGLNSLSVEQRMAVLLVDVQGLSYEEAAAVMGCNLGTVRSRLSRGRGALRDFLRKTGELLPSRFRQDK